MPFICIWKMSCFLVSSCQPREDEDRQMEAAIRASMAMRRQEERGAVQERSAPKHCREEKTERSEPEELKHRNGHIKPASRPPGDFIFVL